MQLRVPIAVLLCVSASAQTIDVGTGAPTPAIQAFPVVAAGLSLTLSTPPGILYFRPCAGTSSIYEFDGSGSGFLDDLTMTDTHVVLPGTSAAQQIAGFPGAWVISALKTTLFSGGIVNARV